MELEAGETKAEQLLAEEKLRGWVQRVASGAMGAGLVMLSLGIFFCGVPALDGALQGRPGAFLHDIADPITLTSLLLYWVTGLGLTVGGIRLHGCRPRACLLLVGLTTVLYWAWLAAAAGIVGRAAWLAVSALVSSRPSPAPRAYGVALFALCVAAAVAAFALYLRRLRRAVMGRIVTAACTTPSALPVVAKEGLTWRHSLLSPSGDGPEEGEYRESRVWLACLPMGAAAAVVYLWLLSIVVGDVRPGASWADYAGRIALLAAALIPAAVGLPRRFVDRVSWDRDGVLLRPRLGRALRLPWGQLEEAQVTLPIGGHESGATLHLFVLGRRRPYAIPVFWKSGAELVRALSGHVRLYDMHPTDRRRTPAREGG